MKKQQTKRTPAAIPAKSKGGTTNTATPPPAAWAEMKEARERLERDVADENSPVSKLFKVIFDCGKALEPTAAEMKKARADCAVALESGTGWMFPGSAGVDKSEAEKAAARAAIVRALTGWIRGDAPPPDGATRADAALRGIAWEGWEWNLRGVDVSRPNAETIDEADRHAECLRRVEKEAAEVLAWKVDNGRPARDNPVTPARKAAERYLEALCDEDEAWCELVAAEKDARATLPAAELAAAKARLDGRAVAAPSPAANPGGKSKRKRGRNLPDDVKQSVLEWIDRERGGDVKGEGWRKAFDAFSVSPDCSPCIRGYVASWPAFKRVAEAARKDRARRLKRTRGQRK